VHRHIVTNGVLTFDTDTMQLQLHYELTDVDMNFSGDPTAALLRSLR